MSADEPTVRLSTTRYLTYRGSAPGGVSRINDQAGSSSWHVAARRYPDATASLRILTRGLGGLSAFAARARSSRCARWLV